MDKIKRGMSDEEAMPHFFFLGKRKPVLKEKRGMEKQGGKKRHGKNMSPAKRFFLKEKFWIKKK